MSQLEVLPARPLDVKLLQLADSHSPEEIGERLRLSPKAVAARITELLKMRDWLTAAQEDALITLKMKRILVQLEDRYLDLDNAMMQLRLLKEIGNRLDKRQAATSVDLSTYNQNVGRVLGQVVDSSLAYMKGALREQVDPELWDTLVMEAMQHARTEIAKNEIEE